jgi:hypothetical protein
MRQPALTGAFAAAFCAIAVSTPGSAQRAANVSTRDISPADRARDTMNRYAICLVDVRRRAVKHALAKIDLQERQTALQRIAASKCLYGGDMQMPEPVFRGALYRALYLEEYGVPPAAAADVPAAADDAADPLQAFGDCVAARKPEAVHALVVAKVATTEENAALSELAPLFGDCAPPRAQIEFSRSMLQATLAEALYKRAVAASPVAGAN